MQRSPLTSPLWLLLCLSASAAHAQTATPVPAPGKTPLEPRVEVITHEDAGSKIDELRIGGQTKRIDVETKTSVPAYQVQPQDSNAHSDPKGTAGRSSWRILKF